MNQRLLYVRVWPNRRDPNCHGSCPSLAVGPTYSQLVGTRCVYTMPINTMMSTAIIARSSSMALQLLKYSMSRSSASLQNVIASRYGRCTHNKIRHCKLQNSFRQILQFRFQDNLRRRCPLKVVKRKYLQPRD